MKYNELINTYSKDYKIEGFFSKISHGARAPLWVVLLAPCGHEVHRIFYEFKRRRTVRCEYCIANKKKETQKSSFLTPLKYIEKKNKNLKWLYKCRCGNEKILYKNLVDMGKTKSCGCLRRKSKRIKVGGKKGYLTILKKHITPKGQLTAYDCLCKCGKTLKLNTKQLVSCKSCGCYHYKKNASFTGKEVLEIRAFYKNGFKIRNIMEIMGLPINKNNCQKIYAIIKRKTYNNLEPHMKPLPKKAP